MAWHDPDVLYGRGDVVEVAITKPMGFHWRHAVVLLTFYDNKNSVHVLVGTQKLKVHSRNVRKVK